MTVNNTEVEADEVELTEYTSESEAPVGEAARRPSASAPGAGTGRRKQAVARVRIVPGTGEWKINGRTLEEYFPNKVHQQIGKLKVYRGAEHPHAAQKPQTFEITQVAQ